MSFMLCRQYVAYIRLLLQVFVKIFYDANNNKSFEFSIRRINLDTWGKFASRYKRWWWHCALRIVIITFCILMQIYPMYQELSFLYWIKNIFVVFIIKYLYEHWQQQLHIYMQHIVCTAWMVLVEHVTAIVHLCVSSIIYLAIKINWKSYITSMYSLLVDNVFGSISSLLNQNFNRCFAMMTLILFQMIVMIVWCWCGRSRQMDRL